MQGCSLVNLPMSRRAFSFPFSKPNPDSTINSYASLFKRDPQIPSGAPTQISSLDYISRCVEAHSTTRLFEYLGPEFRQAAGPLIYEHSLKGASLLMFRTLRRILSSDERNIKEFCAGMSLDANGTDPCLEEVPATDERAVPSLVSVSAKFYEFCCSC